jgi:HEAT repeat protein
MSVSFVRVAIAGIAMFLAVCVFVFVWYGSSLHVQKTIEEWENLGTAHLDQIHRVLTSDLEWGAKERALFAIEKIQDPSSLRHLVNQLYYSGHWWRRGWDGGERYHVDAFRESVMYAICLYGDDGLPILVQELELKGHRASDYAIWGIGLLKTQSARRVLENIARDPNWRPKSEAVTEALRLWSLPEARMAKLSLHPDEVDDELAKLTAAVETGIGLVEEIHFCAVVDSLGSLRVDRSREVLRRIVEQFPSRTIQAASVRALGLIGAPADVPFVCEYVFDCDIDMRREAIIALGKMGDESAIPTLKKVLQREHEAPLNKRLAEKAIDMIR